MGLVNQQHMFLKDVAKLILQAEVLGYQVTGGELWRTPEQQEIYFKNGKSKTLTGSKHLSRLAIDLNFFLAGVLVTSKEAIKPLGTYWESLSPLNKWGGNWTSIVDMPHFERQV